MVDITITAASVVAGTGAIKKSGIAGATIAAGQWVYLDTATGKLLLADANHASAEARQPLGVALNGGAINQPITVQTAGEITIGGTLTAGVAYYLSDTPGGICPVADVGAGEYVCLLGFAKSASVLAIDINYTGVSL